MKEIERKWIVSLTPEVKDLLLSSNAVEISDYYFNKYTRIRKYDGEYYITVKSDASIVRDEFETRIDKPNIDLCPLLVKKRIKFKFKGRVFELNIFRDLPYQENNNCHLLLLAEIELTNENEEIEIPDFFIKEVTNDLAYYGYNLFTRLK